MSGRPLINDLTGQKYGRLLVLYRAPNRKNHVYWKCICDCGRITEVQTSDLIFGKSRSCSCYRTDLLRKSAKSDL